jgi:hypothetical protein
MKYRFLINYPEKISTQILDFFLAELTYARFAKDHELWLVSPWITECNFDLSDRGVYQDLWPGFSKSSISLSSILKKFVDYQSKINIICRPPHLLVPIENISLFHETKKKIAQIENLFEKLATMHDKISEMTTSHRMLKSDIKELTSTIRSTFGELRIFLDILRRNALGQSDVIAFVKDLQNYNPNKVNIYYNYRLHAKILLGKTAGFFGSANITHSGFNFNDELFFYVTDQNILNELHTIAVRLAQQHEGEWWKRKSNEYSILREYQRQLTDKSAIDEMKSSKDFPDDLKAVLELLELF